MGTFGGEGRPVPARGEPGPDARCRRQAGSTDAVRQNTRLEKLRCSMANRKRTPGPVRWGRGGRGKTGQGDT